MLLAVNAGVCDKCDGLRFCDVAQNGNTHKHSKLTGLLHRSSDQQIQPSDKTSLLHCNPDSGIKRQTQHSERSSKHLPFEVCIVL